MDVGAAVHGQLTKADAALAPGKLLELAADKAAGE
jgi:hypothetical protein